MNQPANPGHAKVQRRGQGRKHEKDGGQWNETDTIPYQAGNEHMVAVGGWCRPVPPLPSPTRSAACLPSPSPSSPRHRRERGKHPPQRRRRRRPAWVGLTGEDEAEDEEERVPAKPSPRRLCLHHGFYPRRAPLLFITILPNLKPVPSPASRSVRDSPLLSASQPFFNPLCSNGRESIPFCPLFFHPPLLPLAHANDTLSGEPIRQKLVLNRADFFCAMVLLDRDNYYSY